MKKSKQDRKKLKEKERIRKHLSSVATKADVYQVLQVFERLRDRVMYLDLYTAALEKVLIDRNILTAVEVNEALKYEGERAAKFKEINSGQGDYEHRLITCKKWNIDPSVTTIPDQIFSDLSLTLDQKYDLADKYNIERLKELLDNEKKESIENANQTS